MGRLVKVTLSPRHRRPSATARGARRRGKALRRPAAGAAHRVVALRATRGAQVDGERTAVTRVADDRVQAPPENIAARALAGASLDAREAGALSAALESAMRDFPIFMLPLSERSGRLPLPIVRRFRPSKRAMDAVVERIVRAHRSDGAERGDVLATLIAASDDDMRGGMSDARIRDEAMTILLAGHETTANALAWTFSPLQRHPDVEARLHAHLRETLDGREPKVDDVPRLTYVRAVFAEVLRLYPPAWITAHRATADVVVDGRTARAGELVLVSQYVTHRDPRFWREPERFDPERFGESFAWTEGILAIATIASRIRLARVGDADVANAALVTLRPRSPVRARVERPHRPDPVGSSGVSPPAWSP